MKFAPGVPTIEGKGSAPTPNTVKMLNRSVPSTPRREGGSLLCMESIDRARPLYSI
uniref:Uncharacterized protein n=1 Tax=Picea glauca TaxID=3330 RepID=A0A101M096_PICGL|nr:hypothetical protein ABT39_MTgene4525 [Picea glauca]